MSCPRTPRLLCLAVAATGLSLFASGARADTFEPISLASVGLLPGGSVIEQANVAEHPALSGDGRYVAFDGSFGGITGVWRRDLLSGAIEQVAGGDAQLPSISADGRFISFTSNEGAALAAITNGQANAPQREAPNVFVRDMARAPGAEGAFIVASAPSGSTSALAYETSQPQQFGAVASSRSALSADGRYVAFVTTAVSNLAGAHTPALQVAVRDLATAETRLVSVEYEHGPTTRPVATTEGSATFGAVYEAAPFPATAAAALSQGASISADGSTVAWIGQEVARQAPVFAGAETNPEYVEPLWRRIAGGPQEPTRRVTGGGDPRSPACAASGETQPVQPASLSDPCQGPFEASLKSGQAPGVFASPSRTAALPRLSGDGRTVAFLATQRLLAGGEEFSNAEQSDDLYVTDMADGLTRVQALRRLTELASGNANVGGGFAAISDLGVSPDGSEIAFSTLRTAFPLGSPAYVTAPAPRPEMEELYDVDLANDTLTRVTHGYQEATQQSEPSGEIQAQREAGSPSFSSDGNLLAFSSAAANLVYGEANRANSVFVVARKRFVPEAVQQYISPAPPNPTLEPVWLLSATARSLRDGRVVLEVQAPGAGALGAGADSVVRVGALRSRSAKRHGRRASRSGARRGARVARRQVAQAAQAVDGEGLVTLVLALKRSYRSLARQRGGLSATVELTFTAAGHATLRQRVPVVFVSSSHKRGRRARGRR
jgi:hypothetical protein